MAHKRKSHDFDCGLLLFISNLTKTNYIVPEPDTVCVFLLPNASLNDKIMSDSVAFPFVIL